MATLPKPPDPLQSPTTSVQSTDGRTQQAHVTNTIRGVLRRHGVWPEQVDALAAEIETVIWGSRVFEARNAAGEPPPVEATPAPEPVSVPLEPPPTPPTPPPPMNLPGVNEAEVDPDDEEEPVSPVPKRRTRKRSS